MSSYISQPHVLLVIQTESMGHVELVVSVGKQNFTRLPVQHLKFTITDHILS